MHLKRYELETTMLIKSAKMILSNLLKLQIIFLVAYEEKIKPGSMSFLLE
jgi:hypothetical protein